MRRIRRKKVRGRRNKAKRNVFVADITEEGFWVETYKEKHYISRKDFPWFRDATDEEIRDIAIHLDVDDYHGDVLVWGELNCDIATKNIADSSWVRKMNIFVRNVWRPDLQDWPKIR